MTTAPSAYELSKEVLSVEYALLALRDSINAYESAERNKPFNERNEDTIRACKNAWHDCGDAMSALLNFSCDIY